MAPNKKSKKGKKSQPADDDLDDLLSEFSAPAAPTADASSTEASVVSTSTPAEEDTTSTTVDAAAAYLAQMGLDDVTTDKKKKKKKKKNQSNAAEDKDSSSTPAPAVTATEKKGKTGKKLPSAAAKAIMERQAAQRLEDEELEAQRAAFEAKETARVDAELEKERLRLDALAKKREAKKARIDKQKSDGTYLTPAEKAKAAKAKAAVEAMQAAGMVIAGTEDKPAAKVSYKKNKSKKKVVTPEPVVVIPEVVATPSEKDDASTGVLDDWDAEDWESEAVLEAIQVPGGLMGDGDDSDEEEDLLVLEAKKAKEQLRLQGLEIVRRETEARLAAEANESDSDSSSDDDDGGRGGRNHKHHAKSKATLELESRKRDAADRRNAREADARAAVRLDNLRSPICVIMGHVDTGKTKLLDNIRRTNVQDGEAGGITQQIGATFFPIEAIVEKTKELAKTVNLSYNLPGLLVIDTPGHESFTNLRSRGSSLCDIAILVVDIMHGLEPQTLESIKLLRSKRAPFIVALNKIDRCYGWKVCPDMPIQYALAQQNDNVIREFRDRVAKIKVEFSEQSLNADLYWENKDIGRTISFVPTSAHSGEGVPDILGLLIKLTQERLTASLAFVDILQCTVLEVKVMEGLGTTVDTILVNGSLREGDTIVVCTLEGPVTTTIRSLLTPHPMKEIRVKGEFIHHAHIKAAMGVKICATGLEKAVAGTTVYVLGPDDDEEELKDAVMSDFKSIMNSVNTVKRGVVVQASTLGALEALLEFLKNGCDPPIPVSGVNIGPVHKRDVVRASAQLEHLPEYATILAFDVKVDKDAAEHAAESNVRIFTADIIYHLFDQFTLYMDGIKASRREKFGDSAVFPVILSIIPTCIFNKKDPLILGVDIDEGILKIGTPLVIPTLNNLSVGKVVSIERDNKPIDLARRGSSVAVRIQNESNVAYGRHFDHNSKLVSLLSRESIDALKENFKEDLNKEDWMCVIKLKKLFEII